jgi:hypothetical protein
LSADDFSEERVAERLRALAEAQIKITSMDVASALHVSLTLAQEFLLVRPQAWVWLTSAAADYN